MSVRYLGLCYVLGYVLFNRTSEKDFMKRKHDRWVKIFKCMSNAYGLNL